MWHLFTLGAMVTCGFLAAWQWSRAGSAMGSALNVGYGLQWPLFAVFFAFMWWRFLRVGGGQLPQGPAADTDQEHDAEPEPEVVTAASVPAPTVDGPSPFGPRP